MLIYSHNIRYVVSNYKNNVIFNLDPVKRLEAAAPNVDTAMAKSIVIDADPNTTSAQSSFRKIKLYLIVLI